MFAIWEDYCQSWYIYPIRITMRGFSPFAKVAQLALVTVLFKELLNLILGHSLLRAAPHAPHLFALQGAGHVSREDVPGFGY